ncbi:SET domain-containing protein [Rubritalea marina]|uniref:SET domain-containing protein n=1 Tax=Rubritalea marina TaxID=361055 RepID=UPI00037A8146|nr:SET domain-containing protein-lysine N-methyltransferase [Rubritalea marina]
MSVDEDKKARDKRLKKLAKATRLMKELHERGKSELCEVRHSVIHGRGVYASQDISKETQIIEYIGEYVNKKESEKRAWDQAATAEATGDAAVYIFTLDEKWDIDGNVPWNDARLINHSCDPNCEAWIEEDEIYIYSLRAIKQGEELTFDYGFDIECYEDHPCLCGSDNCVGYIVSREQWPELQKKLAEKAAENASASA